MSDVKKAPVYGTDSIKILSFIDHCRKRSGMWIGSVGEDGIHHLLRELVDNGVDEMVAGHATEMSVFLDGSNNTIIVKDNGRGIPFGKHKDTGTETLVEIFTTSFSGGKFDEENYQLSSGQNGVGLGVTNALSSELVVHSCRGKKLKSLRFLKGILQEEELTSVSFPSHTEIIFTPDPEIFGEAVFNVDRIKESLFQLSCLLPGKNFKLTVNPKGEAPAEVWDFIEAEYLTGLYTKNAPAEAPLFLYRQESKSISTIVSFSGAGQYRTESFMNLIPTTDDGSHVDGVMKALINSFKKLTGKVLTKSQIQYGLGLIVAGNYTAPVFKGQSKSKVADSRIEQAVYQDIYPGLYEALKAAPDFVKYLIAVIEAQSKVVDEFELKTSVSAIKDKVKGNKLPAKLRAVHNCSVDERELIICEGDSAGGGVTTARNPKFQEVLAIKGKILNPFKATKAQLLRSKEVSDIFVSVGGTEDTGTTLRCKKVFILTDADSDGAHITSLVASLFTVLFPSFIQKHELCILNTPLFTAVHGDNRAYGKDVVSAKQEFRRLHGKKLIPEIHRNKGLGEMSPAELVPVLKPGSRDSELLEWSDNSVLEMGRLMGNDMSVRREILKEQTKC